MSDLLHPGLSDVAPDLSGDDALRLISAVEYGYAHLSPKLQLLVDLGYMWDAGTVLYPSIKGNETAVLIAEALWRQAEDSGNAADRARAYVRFTRLQDSTARLAATVARWERDSAS